MSTGTGLMNRVMLALSKAGATVWRNTTAAGWAGKSFTLAPGQVYTARGGERVVLDAYPIKAGLCEGSSDIIGFRSVVVTPDMIGQRVAIFGAWEVKEGAGRPTKPQKNFVGFVERAGGIAAIVRSEADALASISSNTDR